MILPIVAYGAPILHQKSQSITDEYSQLRKLIADMWETLENANGVGLAAPQVNKPIRLFLVDSTRSFDDLTNQEKEQSLDYPGIREVFINPTILSYSQEKWVDEEGCLSIPGLTEQVERSVSISIQYRNTNFETCTETFHGITARMIQHEYDHIEGKLYLDYLNPLKRRLLKNKLAQIAKGKARSRYPMLFM
jgi:peptide deformylase